MKTRLDRISDIVTDSTRACAKQVLMSEVTQHYSEADVNRISDAIASASLEALARNPELNAIATEGDVVDSRGRLNGKAVLSTLEGMEARCTSQGEIAVLRHLAANLKTTMNNHRRLFER